MALLIVLSLLGSLCTAVSDTDTGWALQDQEHVAEFEPHFQRLDGAGQYPYGFRPLLQEIRTDMSVMFVGRKRAGKTRLVERLLRSGPGTFSSVSTENGELFARQLPNAFLWAGDTIGLRDVVPDKHYNELKSIMDLRDLMLTTKVPLKRIYFVVDISTVDGLDSIQEHLEFLKEALSLEAAVQMRFLVNKCELLSSFGEEFFDQFASVLHNVFVEVFKRPPPAILFVSAEKCLGQLYDDIIQAATEPTIPFLPKEMTSSVIRIMAEEGDSFDTAIADPPLLTNPPDANDDPEESEEMLSDNEAGGESCCVDDDQYDAGGDVSCEQVIRSVADKPPGKADDLEPTPRHEQQPTTSKADVVQSATKDAEQSAAVHSKSGVGIISSMLIAAVLIFIGA